MKRIDGKLITFLRRNAIYLVLAFCILAIGLSITLVAVNNGRNTTIENPPSIDEGVTDHPPIDSGKLPDDSVDEPTINPDNPSEPVVSVVKFIMPVETYDYTEYSETPVWSGTLNRFSSHKAMDFFAEEGASVMAVYDGVVESVETTLLDGVTVVIDHGNGLKTVYNSLSDGDLVSVGDGVMQGQTIGTVSITNRQEYRDGAHLHFEVLENGNNINPLNYLSIPEK